MVDTMTMARVRLFAVFRCLEGLVAHDEEARCIADGRREVLEFSVGGVGAARLAIGGGRIEFLPGGGGSTIKLWFPGAPQFNALFAGEGKPIPVRGFTRLGYLSGPFTQLTERLSHYLRPRSELLSDRSYRAANAELSLHAAFYALSEVGNHDPDGRLNAARMADGGVLVAAKGGPAMTVLARGGRLETRKGQAEGIRARMIFASLDKAGAMIRGEMSSYAAIGAGDVALSGYTPLIDHMNKVLGIVPRYLG